MSIATIGFLLIKKIFDDKMKKLSEENDKIDLQQKSFMHWIEEANSMRELADLKEDNINILKIINFPDTGLKEKNRCLSNIIIVPQ